MNTKVTELLLDFDIDPPENLTISLKSVKESFITLIIKPVGSINTYSSSYFQRKIEMVIDKGFTVLIFDMSNIEYVSAVGIGSFIHIVDRVREYKGKVFLNNLPLKIADVFKLPGFEEYFTFNVDYKSAFLSSKDRELDKN